MKKGVLESSSHLVDDFRPIKVFRDALGNGVPNIEQSQHQLYCVSKFLFLRIRGSEHFHDEFRTEHCVHKCSIQLVTHVISKLKICLGNLSLLEPGCNDQVSTITGQQLCCSARMHAYETVLGNGFTNIAIDQLSDRGFDEAH